MLIKFRLEKWEKALVFQVLEQSKEITSMLGRISLIKTENIEISSSNHLDMESDTVIFIRGTCKKCDLFVSTLNFDSNRERDEVYNNILDAFRCLKSEYGHKADSNNGIFEF